MLDMPFGGESFDVVIEKGTMVKGPLSIDVVHLMDLQIVSGLGYLLSERNIIALLFPARLSGGISYLSEHACFVTEIC